MSVHSRIKFDPRRHTYTLDGRVLPSVTGVVKRLVPEFDAVGKAEVVAAREGVDIEEILAGWKAKGQAAMERGKIVHAAIETVLHGKPLAGAALASAEVAAWRGWWDKASASLKVRGVEMIVGDAELGVAGTLDAMFDSGKTGKAHVFDWKTGGTFETENRWGRFLLPPFDDVPDNELQRYSLQVSLYRLILERDGETGALGDGWIVHLADAAEAHRAVDYRERLAAWLLEPGTQETLANKGRKRGDSGSGQCLRGSKRCENK